MSNQSELQVNELVKQVLSEIQRPQWVVKGFLSKMHEAAGVYAIAESRESGSMEKVLKIVACHDQLHTQRIAKLYQQIQQLSNREDSHIVPIEKVGVFQAQTAPTYVYIVMKKLVPLSDYLRNNHLTVLEALKGFQNIADALNICHNSGIFHHDVKPENILIQKHGGTLSFALTDFDSATTGNGDASSESTPMYDDPDSDGHQRPGAHDMYALGITFYTLFNGGTLPNKKDNEKYCSPMHAWSKFDKGEDKNGIDGTGDVICKACALRDENRYASMADLKQALAGLIDLTEQEDTVYLTHSVQEEISDAQRETRKVFEEPKVTSVATEQPVKGPSSSTGEQPVKEPPSLTDILDILKRLPKWVIPAVAAAVLVVFVAAGSLSSPRVPDTAGFRVTRRCVYQVPVFTDLESPEANEYLSRLNNDPDLNTSLRATAQKAEKISLLPNAKNNASYLLLLNINWDELPKDNTVYIRLLYGKEQYEITSRETPYDSVTIFNLLDELFEKRFRAKGVVPEGDVTIEVYWGKKRITSFTMPVEVK